MYIVCDSKRILVNVYINFSKSNCLFRCDFERFVQIFRDSCEYNVILENDKGIYKDYIFYLCGIDIIKLFKQICNV